MISDFGFLDLSIKKKEREMSFSVNIDRTDIFPVITLKDESSGTEAEVYSFGALLNAFTVTTKFGRKNIIDGFTSPADAKENITKGFKSAKLSPFVCRVDKGEYTFDEKKFKLQKFYLGNEAIHGLIYDAPFSITDSGKNNNNCFVKMAYEYNNVNEGFPFSYSCEVTYTLSENNSLSLQTVITNTGDTDMPLSEGWHPYFQLGETVNDLEVMINSNTMLEFNNRLLPTGNFISYKEFEQSKLFGNTSLDNCFLLKDTSSPACILKDIKTGLQLAIIPGESYRYLQVYAPPHRKSIAVENLSGAPDSFNNGIGLIIAKPGEQYSFVTSYQITTL
jgi:aldose 1-epimerase